MKPMRTILIILTAFSLLFFAGCRENNDSGGHSHGTGTEDGHAHGDEGNSTAVTRWTGDMELFMEYPPLVRGVSLDFIVHLTILKEFQPVRSGLLMLEFTPEKNGNTFIVRERDLLRDGIFAPIVFFSNTGNYRFSVRYEGESLKDSFEIGMVTVVEDESEIPVDHAEEGGLEISFLKEQQWKTEFATRPARVMAVKPSVHASAEVLPHNLGQVEVIAPVAGILSPGSNSMAAPGQRVKRGETLAVLAPPFGGGGGWTQAKIAYKQAKKQFERAGRLQHKGAISTREYETIKQRYETLKAGFASLGASGRGRAGGAYFSVASPIDGVVAQIDAMAGQNMARGAKLMTIVDASRVWLKVNLFQKDFYKLKAPAGAEVHFPGLESPLFLNPEDMLRVSDGYILDARSRTIPLIFEVANVDGNFKIGQVLRARLYIDKEQRAVCVPREAVYDDEGHQVAFVQLAGESFEKREIQTGPASFGWISVLSGIKEGERVVTRGAYLVKLAGTSTAIGHGHTH